MSFQEKTVTIHAHVRELLRFEEQRLAIAIDCSADPEQEPSTTCVIVRLPHPDALTRLASIPGREDQQWRLHVTCLSAGEPLCIESETGPVAIAAVEANLVRLAFDPSLLARDSDRRLLSRLWERAVVPALEQAARHALETADSAQVEAFTRLEERWRRETLARLPGAIESNEYSLTRLESQIRDLVQKTDDMRRQERALRLLPHASLQDVARQQWTALRRLVPEAYRAIELRGSALVALTREVTIEHDEMSVDVGEFEIDIDVVAGTITISNRTNPVGGAQHPHVRDAGQACWGNLHAGVTRLLAEREWAGLLSIAHAFLRSYNDRDAYVKLEAWDPDHHEEDEDDADYDDDSEDETVGCSLCAEHVASDEITHVQDEPVCMACYERDTMACAGPCARRILSRNQARVCEDCAVVLPATDSQEVPS